MVRNSKSRDLNLRGLKLTQLTGLIINRAIARFSPFIPPRASRIHPYPRSPAIRLGDTPCTRFRERSSMIFLPLFFFSFLPRGIMSVACPINPSDLTCMIRLRALLLSSSLPPVFGLSFRTTENSHGLLLTDDRDRETLGIGEQPNMGLVKGSLSSAVIDYLFFPDYVN